MNRKIFLEEIRDDVEDNVMKEQINMREGVMQIMNMTTMPIVIVYLIFKEAFNVMIYPEIILTVQTDCYPRFVVLLHKNKRKMKIKNKSCKLQL